jgi:hypothetical protein
MEENLAVQILALQESTQKQVSEKLYQKTLNKFNIIKDLIIEMCVRTVVVKNSEDKSFNLQLHHGIDMIIHRNKIDFKVKNSSHHLNSIMDKEFCEEYYKVCKKMFPGIGKRCGVSVVEFKDAKEKRTMNKRYLWVYLLLNDLGEIVYCGRSSNPDGRITSHRRSGKKFHKMIKYKLDSSEAVTMESDIIMVHNPAYNKDMTGLYMTAKSRKKIEIRIESFKKRSKETKEKIFS